VAGERERERERERAFWLVPKKRKSQAAALTVPSLFSNYDIVKYISARKANCGPRKSKRENDARLTETDVLPCPVSLSPNLGSISTNKIRRLETKLLLLRGGHVSVTRSGLIIISAINKQGS
jgi:hypothetical protein